MENANKSESGKMDLSDLLEHALKDIYYAEKKIHKALPKMIRAAQDPVLKKSLTAHHDETATQIEMLEQAFSAMGKKPKAEKCDAIDGIIDESTSLLETFKESSAIDAAIIFSAQAVEHYEITRYGSMQAYAKVLGLRDVESILGKILDQEYAVDKKLSSLAESSVNKAAA